MMQNEINETREEASRVCTGDSSINITKNVIDLNNSTKTVDSIECRTQSINLNNPTKGIDNKAFKDIKTLKDGYLSVSTEKGKRKSADKPPLSDARFDEFWDAYPKKIGKGAAKKSWDKLRPSQKLFDEIMLAIAEQKESDQWNRERGQFIPNPSTWLNQERWEDKLERKRNQISRAEQEADDYNNMLREWIEESSSKQRAASN